MIEVEQVAEVFVEMADTLVDDFDVVDFLKFVTIRTVSMSDSASAGLLLADHHGQLQFAAASDESVKLLELFQLQNAEGPCLECFNTGSPVANTDLDRAGDHWPVFAPHAVSAGFHSVHAFPLRHRRDVIGALDLFGTQSGALEPGDVRIIQALADIATIGLLHGPIVGDQRNGVEQLQDALSRRVTDEQAKGVLARKLGVTVEAAAELMHDYARLNRQDLSDVSQAVVDDPGLIPAVADSGPIQATDPDKLLTPAEVAAIFRVDPKTIARWAVSGQLSSIRTLGGHRRFHHSEVTRLLNME